MPATSAPASAAPAMLGAADRRVPVAPPPAIGPFLDRAAAVAIILVAAYLRLVRLDFAQWRNDEEIIWLHALRALAAGRIPWQGIPSDLGIANGPGELLPVLPAAALGSPYIAYVLVAFLNVLAVAALIRLGRLLYGSHLGLAAGLLCAVAPWDVMHSRRLWGNDMLAPFAVLFVTALWQVAALRREWKLVPALGWLALLLQMYIAAIVQLAVLAVGLTLAAVGYSRRALRRLGLPLLAGLALFSALFAGYAVTTFLPHAADLVHAVRDTRPDTPNPVGLPNWAAFPLLLQSVAGDGYQYYLGHAAGQADATGGPDAAASALAGLLFLAGVAFLLWELVRFRLGRRGGGDKGRGIAAALLLTWLLALPAALVAHAAPVCACFLLPSYPVQYLVVALGAFAAGRAVSWPAALSRRAARRSADLLARRFIPWALVAAVATVQLGTVVPFLASINQYWPDDRYGLPYAWHGRIVAAVRQAWQPGSAIVVSGHGELDGVLRDEIETDLPGSAPRIVDDGAWLTLPGPGRPAMVVLLTPGDSPAHAVLEQLLAARPGSQRAAVTIPGAGLRYRVLIVTPADAAAVGSAPAAADHPLSAQFARDVRLEQVVLPNRLLPGRQTPVRLAWTVLRSRPYIPAESYFLHLVRAGTTTAALDSAFLPPGLWQQGERVWTFGAISDSGGGDDPLRDVQLGLYVLRGKDGAAGVQPIAARGPTGQPLDVVRVGPVVVRAPGPTSSVRSDHLAAGLVLLGADAPPSASAGTGVSFTLRWQATEPLPRYTVFIHLLDAAGTLRAQQDGEPDGGRFPTLAWLPGEQVDDLHTVPLPAGFAYGDYRVVVGVYPTGHPDQPRSVTLPRPLSVQAG